LSFKFAKRLSPYGSPRVSIHNWCQFLPFFEDPAPALNIEQDSVLSIVKATIFRAISGPNLYPWELNERGYKK
jgi:hypothetical protein